MNKLDLFKAAKSLNLSKLPGQQTLIQKAIQDKYGLLDKASASVESQIFSLIEKSSEKALYMLGDIIHPLDEAFIILENAIAESEKTFAGVGNDEINHYASDYARQDQPDSGPAAFDVYSLIRGIFAFECPSGQSYEKLDPVNSYVHKGFGPVKFPSQPVHTLVEWERLLKKSIGPEMDLSQPSDEINFLYNKPVEQNPDVEKGDKVNHGKPTSTDPENINKPVPVEEKKKEPARKSVIYGKTVNKEKQNKATAGLAKDLYMTIVNRKLDQGWGFDRIKSFFGNLFEKNT